MKLGQNVNWNISEQLAKTACQKKLFRVLTTVNMRKMTFLSISSTLKFLKFFYIVNLDNSNCFFGPAGGVSHQKNFSAPF